MEESVNSLSNIDIEKSDLSNIKITFYFDDNSNVSISVKVEETNIVPLKAKDMFIYRGINKDIISMIKEKIFNEV